MSRLAFGDAALFLPGGRDAGLPAGRVEVQQRAPGGYWIIIPDDPRPAVVAAPSELFKISDAATRHVRRNLHRETAHRTEAWESFSLASLAEFTADAKRWLRDHTDLSGRVLDSADYAELFAELTE